MNSDSITLGGGCFWCLDAVFRLQPGVENVVCGYAGGSTANPTYEQVSMGTTGHAEVVKLEFSPQKVTLEKILEIFWQIHDPTTLNRQGHDEGSQYRSIILYNSELQKQVIEKSISEIAIPKWGSITTEIESLKVFYPAEDYHQDYFNKNPDSPYCQVVISPKVKKFLNNSEF